MKTIVRCAAVAALIAGLALILGADKPAAGWKQWGGPTQEFNAPGAKLAKQWSEEGPKRLWEREIGEGYSAILVEGNRLYTMFREGDHEVVVCLDAKAGEPVWERRYEASPREGHVSQFGDGPRATPLIVGDLLYSIGVSGKMHALKKSSGEVVWSRDLWGEELGGNVLNHGYSSSPIAHKNTIIALVGGEGASIVAFNAKDGSLVWKAQSFKNSYSTPQILSVDGQDQMVVFMAEELIGLDPENGDLKWSVPHKNQWGQNINMPVMADANHMFLSALGAGAKGLKLTNRDNKTDVEEVWTTRKIQYYHVTSVRDGDYVYGSTGGGAPSFMSAVNIKTGEIAWRKRGFAKANCIAADGRLFILDEDGKLAMATATPDDLTIHSEVELMESRAWTVPTIVGKTMYVRDNKTIVALDLG